MGGKVKVHMHDGFTVPVADLALDSKSVLRKGRIVVWLILLLRSSMMTCHNRYV